MTLTNSENELPDTGMHLYFLYDEHLPLTKYLMGDKVSGSHITMTTGHVRDWVRRQLLWLQSMLLDRAWWRGHVSGDSSWQTRKIAGNQTHGFCKSGCCWLQPSL